MPSRSGSIEQKSNAEVDVKQGKWVKGMGKRKLTWLACILASGLIMSASSQAALLNLSSSNPDLFSPNLSNSLAVAFNASSGLFTATGDTAGYTAADPNLNDGQPYIVGNSYDNYNPGTFSLTATIATNGSLLGGTVLITGGIYATDENLTQVEPDDTVLLQGDLIAFGFQGYTDAPDQFDFGVAVTGGALADQYGSSAYILLHPGYTSFDNIFTVGFSNDGQGDADTRMIPEPTSGLLVLLSLFGLCGVMRRVPQRKCSQ